MNIYLNRISGIEDAIISLFISKRNWSRELENKVYTVCRHVLTDRGGPAAPDHPDSVASVKDKLDAISRQRTDGDA